MDSPHPITGKKQGSKYANPTSWKKGYCPNPKGRPRNEFSISQRAKEIFATTPELKDQIIHSMIDAAVNHQSVPAAKFILSYVDGTPVPMKIVSELQNGKEELSRSLAEELRACFRQQ